MYDNTNDLFREMDARADHLFARMIRNFRTGIPQENRYRVVIRNGDNLAEPFGEPEINPLLSSSNPQPEVHQVGDEVMVILGLHGATRESVHVAVGGDELIIDAGCGSRHYHTTVPLPLFDPGSMETSIKNGVLEVKFRIPAGSS